MTYDTKDSGERAEFETGMQRDTNAGKARFDLIRPKGQPYADQLLTRWAELMARGAVKYDARNWEKACTQEELDRFLDSADRHFAQWAAGETDEDHAAAVLFNIQGAEYVKWRMAQAESDETQPYSSVFIPGLLIDGIDVTDGSWKFMGHATPVKREDPSLVVSEDQEADPDYDEWLDWEPVDAASRKERAAEQAAVQRIEQARGDRVDTSLYEQAAWEAGLEPSTAHVEWADPNSRMLGTIKYAMQQMHEQRGGHYSYPQRFAAGMEDPRTPETKAIEEEAALLAHDIHDLDELDPVDIASDEVEKLIRAGWHKTTLPIDLT